ncbi:hypothetical protein JXA85_02535, partial [Candidatus Woesearchaeota archaeon]|nr:hypothetical protein [Candidatus Woesearchaeota archaeon]
MGNKLIKLSGGDSALIITPKQKKALGLDETYEYEIRRITENRWEIIQTDVTEYKEKNLVDKLESMTFHDRMEGNLEKQLSIKEYEALVILLKTGEVIKFKGGEQYKKHVFITKKEYDRITGKKEKASEPKSSEDPEETFKNNGFSVIKNSKDAYEFSRAHYSDFQKGAAVGIKSFTGSYYVIKKTVFQDNYAKVIGALKEEKDSIHTISKYIGKDEQLTECLLAIMQDKGI